MSEAQSVSLIASYQINCGGGVYFMKVYPTASASMTLAFCLTFLIVACYRFHFINNKYLKPAIVGHKNPQRRGWQIWSVYNKLNDKSARQIIRSVNSSASLSVLFRNAFETDLSRSSSVTQLVASPTTMNHSASGFADSWQW